MEGIQLPPADQTFPFQCHRPSIAYARISEVVACSCHRGADHLTSAGVEYDSLGDFKMQFFQGLLHRLCDSKLSDLADSCLLHFPPGVHSDLPGSETQDIVDALLWSYRFCMFFLPLLRNFRWWRLKWNPEDD